MTGYVLKGYLNQYKEVHVVNDFWTRSVIDSNLAYENECLKEPLTQIKEYKLIEIV